MKLTDWPCLLAQDTLNGCCYDKGGAEREPMTRSYVYRYDYFLPTHNNFLMRQQSARQVSILRFSCASISLKCRVFNSYAPKFKINKMFDLV